MNIPMNITKSWLVAVAAACLSGAAMAQFPGDVYLQTPANVVAAGGELALRVNTFTGTQRLGAVQFTLAFDPAVLQFVGSALPADSPLQVSVNSKGGRLGIVVTNAKGVNEPFGVVPLADLRFRAVGQPLATTSLNLTSVAMISLAGGNLTTAAIDGTVLVTSAAAATLAATLPGGAPSLPSPAVVTMANPLVPSRDERNAAEAMGRPGQAVALWRAVPYAGGIAAARVDVVVPTVTAGESVPESSATRR
jgi:hypothetical protein